MIIQIYSRINYINVNTNKALFYVVYISKMY